MTRNSVFKMQGFMFIVIKMVVGVFLFGSTTVSTDPLKLTNLIRSNVGMARNQSAVAYGHGMPTNIPASHSGYITVNETLGNHYFFWYFKNNNTTAPLLVFLSGGPGQSSLEGLLWENGPIKIDLENKQNVRRRHNAFTKSFSVLYIDNPVGAGYSYSDSGDRGFRGTMEQYGEDLAEFMEQFVQLFPAYQTANDVYIGGKSYAGKYVPAMADKIDKKKELGTSHVNLKGIYLASPMFDPETLLEYGNDYLFSLGAISKKQLDDQKRLVRAKFVEFNAGRLNNENKDEYFTSNYPFGITYFNYVTQEMIDDSATAAIANGTTFRTALHVGNRHFIGFSMQGIISKMVYDLRRSSKSLLAKLMHKYKVLIYSGDYDQMISINGIEEGLMSMDSNKWGKVGEYKDAARSKWNGNDKKLLGFSTRVGDFCRVIVHGAGHHTGYDQPDTVLLMLQQFVNDGCVSSL